MAIGLKNKPGVSVPTGDYPDGRITDGLTPVSQQVYDDFHQFFAKLLRLTGIVPNNASENESNGYQYIDALFHAVAGSTEINNVVQNYVNNLVDSAPNALDTLNELAAALGDDANFATTVTNQLALKANKNQPNWIDMVLVNGWGSAGRTPQYRKDEFGMVHIRGLLDSSSATDKVFWNPPAGFVAPTTPQLVLFPIARRTGSTYTADGVMSLDTFSPTKSVKIEDYSTSHNYYLEGIQYSVESI